jgi:site-specific recombinase XerD
MELQLQYTKINRFMGQKHDIEKNTRISIESDVKLFLNECNSIKKAKSEKELLQSLEGTEDGIMFVEDIFNSMKKKYADSSYNKKLTNIRGFFNYLVKARTIKESPIGTLEKIKMPVSVQDFEDEFDEEAEEGKYTRGKQLLNREEMLQVLSSIDINRKELYTKCVDFLSTRDRLLLALMFCTGLRISEALNIKLSDIKKVENGYMVNIKKHKTSKKIGAKRVPLANKCIQYYHEYLDERNKLKNIDETYLFLSFSGKRIEDTKSIRLGYQKILDSVGIKKKTTLHCLRYSFRNIATENNINYEIILMIGGWTRKGMGKVYQKDNIEKDDMKIIASNLL